jgi:hypothetical protein
MERNSCGYSNDVIDTVDGIVIILIIILIIIKTNIAALLSSLYSFTEQP